MKPFERIVKDDPVNSPKMRVGLNRVFDILESITGDLERVGDRWKIGRAYAAPTPPPATAGGITGYEEVEGTLYTKEAQYDGTFLIKTGYTKTEYTNTQERLLLNIVSVTTETGTVYRLVPGKGYLKA